MKKVLSVLLVACLCCGMVAGCTKDKEVISEESVNIDFNEDTNKTVHLKDIQFKIPVNWKQIDIDERESAETVMCFESDNVYLKVFQGRKDIDEMSEASFKGYLSGLGIRFGGFEVGKITDEEFGDNRAKVADVIFSIGSTIYKGNVFKLETADFVFGVGTDTTMDYSNDIKEVLKSVEKSEIIESVSPEAEKEQQEEQVEGQENSKVKVYTNTPDEIELMSYVQTVIEDYFPDAKYSRNKTDYTFIQTDLRYKIEGKVSRQKGEAEEKFYMIIQFDDDKFESYTLQSFQIGNENLK